MSDNAQSRAEDFIRRLVGGPSTTRADELIEKLTEKGPRREDERERPGKGDHPGGSRSLVEEVGRDKGPQIGGKKS
jgi:hypothetical protein